MPTKTDRLVAPTEAPPVASFRRVLKNQNFMLLWLAQLISMTILNAANFGIIVLVNNITHSAVMAGVAIICFTLPALPFGAIAGVFVDRLNKRVVLWVSNVLRAILMFLIFASLMYNHSDLIPIYILIFLVSLVGQFFIPAEGASIPLIVGERELMPALSLFNITMTVSQAIGFLLLGSLITKLIPPFTLPLGFVTWNVQPTDSLFLLVTFFYLVCAALIFMIPTHIFEEKHIQQRTEDTRAEAGKAIERLWGEIVEGWQFVRHDRILYYSVMQLSVVGNIMLLIGELAGPFVEQVLHHPASDMAIILAPAAIGLVGASIIMPQITERVGKIRLTVIGFIVLSLGFLLLPGSQWLALRIDPRHGSESPLLLWTTIILLFVLGIAMACVNIPTQTMMQEHSPEEVRGRVFALQSVIYNAGSIPILLFAGILVQYVGFPEFIIVLSSCMLLFCWWGTRYVRAKKQKDDPTKKDHPSEPMDDPLSPPPQYHAS